MSAGICISTDKLSENNNNEKIILKIKKSKLNLINNDTRKKTSNKSKKTIVENNTSSDLITPKVEIDIYEKKDVIKDQSDIDIKSNLNCNKKQNIYNKMTVSKRITLPISKITCNLNNILENYICEQFDGKCNVDGFIKPNSTKLLTYSCGVIFSNYVLFDVTFECLVCSPVEGNKIDVIVKNITKAGVRAEIDENPTPLVVFISRNTNPKYNILVDNLKQNDIIKVKIIGKRYELNDKFISVIAELC